MSLRAAASLVALHDVSFALPEGRPLLDHIDLGFGAERTGLVGRNGVGKSTLLKIITGETLPSGGSVSRAGRIGLLRQIVQPEPGEVVADALGITADLERLGRLERGVGTDEDFVEADWTLETRLADALAAVELAGLDSARPMESLSGGQRTRLGLAALLLAEPDLILLDEPTNNLDAEGRAAVARILAGWKKGAIVVSHDRALLRDMDRIVELSALGVRMYGGNYDLYAERKSAERANAARELDLAKAEAKATERRIQASVERQQKRDSRGARARARNDQPKILLDGKRDRSERTAGALGQRAERQRQEAAELLASAVAEVERVETLALRLPSTGLPAGRAVLAFENVDFAYPDLPATIHQLNLTITGPERIALVGANGAGKSTLLRLAAGRLEPTGGRIQRPVASAMLGQSVEFLDPTLSIVENFRRFNPDASLNHAHMVLARFLYRNQAALKPVHALSGGEMLRAGLACVLGGATPPGLLILDEPTNHLDFDSIAAIEAALREFDGALLVASHDEDFLEAIGIERRISFPLAGATRAFPA
ncbi:ABC-F family ATP-binding cassette domain-containing protein [Kaistia nematophila]|uniref:ABC-F family ATP-binding cassette domain-containing protein n=1 Tax=Kaistia nematophila TaxID=2994654 RepID=A0A9X3E339_9HYPH|nr:ABC-F family ATP-binding cassette domain-containing protein [Kaistia nematophila]MCX5570881.1 ABC-F family ATP-binding cassette domain-containing protein [Kaistia nematophila]